MSRLILLSDDERTEVLEILRRCLPQNVRIGVFGSRAGGDPKPWSDLDLVVEGEAPLALSVIAELNEAFAESALPWKVDIVDRKAVSPAFGAIIDREQMAFA